MSSRIAVGGLLAAGLSVLGAAGAGAAPSGMPHTAATPSPTTASAHGGYFRDAFNFQAPGWRGVVGRWSVKNGTLFAQGMPGRFSSVKHVNTYDDFDYEVRMNRIGNSDGSAPNCLIIRANPNRLSEADLWLPGYYFCYTNNGKALAVAFDARGNRRELMDYTPVKEIGTGGGYRTVRVQAFDHLFYFSVNGKEIGAFKDDLSSFGQVGAGFYVEPGKRGSLALDYANLGPIKAAISG